MSARPAAIDARRGVLTVVPIVAGIVALSLRAVVVGAADATIVFAAILGLLAAVSLLTPNGGTSRARLPRSLVLAFGVAVVLAAAIAAGAGFPLPHGALVLALGVAAAVSEELFFRRLVYGALEPWHPAAAIIGSALLFALVHVPLYGPAVFWVDLGAGLLFSWQRWASDDWTAPAATHAVANVLAVLR
jgi:membrane protease YdiL (CAAX protease family)